MATYIPASRAAEYNIPTPLTLTALQTFVGGFIQFIELTSGDQIVVNESSFAGLAPRNPTASSIAGKAGPIYGDAVLCSPSEIA